MKDLYTFDSSRLAALDTYKDVTGAYHRFFDEIGVPFIVARASSGAMGGDMSHEYHYPSDHGEDTLFRCVAPGCGHVENSELFPIREPEDLKNISCVRCKNQMEPLTAIEVGHTFHLGTRYSAPLSASILVPTEDNRSASQHLEMGCHGIGLSRLIPAIISSTSVPASNTLNWPRVTAPFEAVVVGAGDKSEAAIQVYDSLKSIGKVDVALDDRDHREFGWKMKDADMIGYPVIVVVGRAWESEGVRQVEVQWSEQGKRQKTHVNLDGLDATIRKVLKM